MMGSVAGERSAISPGGRTIGRVAFMAAVAVLLGAVLSLALPRWLERYAEYDPDSQVAEVFEDRTGIRLVRVALTGGGSFLDVRYQVLDSTKALETFQQTGPGHPTLVDEAIGSKLVRPFMGHAPHAKLNEAVTYFVILENPGDVVQPGGTVTVVMGAARLEHVPVE